MNDSEQNEASVKKLVQGHFGKPFPHLCPGEYCAIMRFIAEKIWRRE